MNANHNTAMPDPSPELYARVRADFVAQGTSLNRWCQENNVLRQSARAVLLGERDGPKARSLRSRLIDASKAKDVTP